MADWFKLHENWFTEPRLQWAIREQATTPIVWLWCLTECCRIGSDTIGLHQEDFEMIGIQQLLNVSPGIFVQSIGLLEKIKYIETDSVKKTIKVLKWSDFQSTYLNRKNKGDYENRTKDRIVSDNIGYSPVEEKRIEEKRVDKNKEEYSNDFEYFWVSYPNKSGKFKAYQSWLKTKPSLTMIETIMVALENQKKSASWLKENGKFIPHASTWLNGKRWEDEINNNQKRKDPSWYNNI